MFDNFRMPVARRFVPTPWRSLLAALSVFVLLLMGTPSVHAQPSQQNQMAKILADWKAREAEIHSLRMTWTQEKLIPRGSLPKMGPEVVNRPPDDAVVPPDDVRLSTTHVFELDGERVHYSQEGEDWSATKNLLTPIREERVWDGKTNSSFNDVKAATYPYGTVEGGRMHFMFTNNPELLVIRMFARPVMPAFDGLLRPDSLRWTPRTGTANDRSCIVLEQGAASRRPGKLPPSHYEVWVDSKRQSLPVRWLAISGGNSRVDLNIEYQETDAHHWRPSRWTLHQGGGADGTLSKSISATVQEFVLNPELPASTFAFNPPPGTMIGDKRVGSQPQFHVVRTDGTRRDLQPGESGEDYAQLVKPQGRWSIFAIRGAALLLALIAVAVAFRRRLSSQ